MVPSKGNAMVPNSVLKDLIHPDIAASQRKLDSHVKEYDEKQELLEKLTSELETMKKKRIYQGQAHAGDTTLGSLHDGYSQFLNPTTIEELEEK